MNHFDNVSKGIFFLASYAPTLELIPINNSSPFSWEVEYSMQAAIVITIYGSEHLLSNIDKKFLNDLGWRSEQNDQYWVYRG